MSLTVGRIFISPFPQKLAIDRSALIKDIKLSLKKKKKKK